ncbi:aspartyl/asparaginyl beta-hydroxylase domain-containing protein [Pelagibacteraceae bacterium]|nr:aspartyl/asparaginyl beta-hydroxylase domain-containing protein [Pelagibacteraceae bacterium]
MTHLNFKDFYQVPDLKFDITRLRQDLEEVLKKKKFASPGVSHFGAISVNQVPNDAESVKGNNIRGVYWTIADESGKEVSRDIKIDESKYTEVVPEFQKTYFKEVYDILSKKFKLGRVRILLKEPRSTLSWHRDPEPRLHIPIITNPGCSMVIENIAKHLPADGCVTITNNTKYHNFFNGGEQARIHLVACLLEDPFNK